MSRGKITALLDAHTSGDPTALDELLPLVYDEMHRLAHQRIQRERSGHTLSPTALVHEAYLKLIQFDRINWQNRHHFYAIASQAMRNILVDYAVKRKAQKRGGNRKRVTLHEGDARTEVNLSDVVAVHHALERLSSVDERQVQVVECRFFGGLTIQETADALDISPATVGRDWKMARAWLNRELTR